MRQLPVLPPETYSVLTPWATRETLASWIAPRVLELTYTAYDMTPFARDCGYDGEPFIWNDERRFQLRCELDAAYFHLYGINQGDLDYIMGTFPIVKRKDEAAHGTYRTRDRILEIYDQMAAGHFVSPLDPPPAHGWVPPTDKQPSPPTPSSPHGSQARREEGHRSEGRTERGDVARDPLPNEERVPGEEGRRLSGGEMVGGEMVGGEMVGGEMANEEMVSAETPLAPDLGASDDDSPLTLPLPMGRVRVNGQDAELLEKKALGGGRVQYRVILDATGEIKNFVSPPATVEEGT